MIRAFATMSCGAALVLAHDYFDIMVFGIAGGALLGIATVSLFRELRQ